MDRTWRASATRAVRAACLVFALLLALPLLLPGGAPAGVADEMEEDVGPAGDFLLGHGSARGTGVRVGPSRSGFNFTTDFAVSLADYQNTVARGDSRGVTLGMILETVVEAADEEGEHLPQNLRIDSRDEGAADGVSRQEFGADEGPFAGAVGSQHVRATADPFAEAETLMGVLGLEALVELEGGASRATAGIVEDGQRQALGEATFERIVLGGGAVVLEGLEWTALHRSGAEEQVDAAFTLGDIKIDGESQLPEDASEQGADALATAVDGANEVLSELGLNLEAPEMAVNDETGQVEMTPLKVSLGPSDISQELFRSPLGDVIQEVREPLADALLDAEEAFGAVFLLFDVGLGAFAGGGEVLLEIGGARAVTGAQEFDDPFGGEGGVGEDFGELPDETSPQDAEQPDLGDGPDASADLEGTAGGGDGDAPAPQASEPPEAGDGEEPEPVEEPVSSAPPGGDSGEQESATVAAAPGSRGGQALTAALIALLVAAGLGGADFLRLRHSQRTIPT